MLHRCTPPFYRSIKTESRLLRRVLNKHKTARRRFWCFFIVLFSQLETLVGKIRSEQGDRQIRPDGRLYAENYYALLEDKHSQVQNEKKEKN